jgi:hypothetical protein
LIFHTVLGHDTGIEQELVLAGQRLFSELPNVRFVSKADTHNLLCRTVIRISHSLSATIARAA